MPLDPSIVSGGVGIQPPVANPANSFEAAQTRQTAFEQGQAIRTQRIDAAQDMAAYRSALQQANGSVPDAIDILLKAGKPGPALAAQKEWDTHLGDVEKTTDQHLKNQKAEAELVSNLTRGITDEHSFQAVASIVDPKYRQMLGDSYDPARIKALQDQATSAKDMADIQHQSFTDLLAAGTDSDKQYQALINGLGAVNDPQSWDGAKQLAMTRPNADKARIAAIPPFSPAAQQWVKDASRTQVQRDELPLRAAQTKEAEARAAAAPITAQADLLKAQTAAKSASAAGGLDQEAIDQAAEKYYASGQLPAGMGGSAVARNNAIMNRAGQLHPGATLAENSAAFKANQSSLTNITRTLDTLSAFENTAGKNLQQFLALAETIPDTGVPWLNTPVRSLNKNVVGDANMAAITAARDVALREIARVTNDPKLSGSLTDSARQEVAGLSPANATLPQIKAVAKVLMQDMANVHSSLDTQKADIQQRLGGKTPPPSSGGAYAGEVRQGKSGPIGRLADGTIVNLKSDDGGKTYTVIR